MTIAYRYWVVFIEECRLIDDDDDDDDDGDGDIHSVQSVYALVICRGIAIGVAVITRDAPL